MRLTRKGIVALSLITSMAVLGVSYACYTGITYGSTVCTTYCDTRFSWVVSNDNGSVQTRSPYGTIDPGDNGIDPDGLHTSAPQNRGQLCLRYDKPVACTTAVIMCDPDLMTVTLNNAYPYYFPTIFFGLKNYGNVPTRIQSITIDENPDDSNPESRIDDITVKLYDICVGQTIATCNELVGRVTVLTEQVAKQNWTYKFTITIVTVCQETEGTPGFWRNNWAHFYSNTEMLNWLRLIDKNISNVNSWDFNSGTGSKWINDPNGSPFSITDMYTIFDQGVSGSATPRTRFLRHYLATRLNAIAVDPARLYLDNTHNITGVSGYGYLGLANPTSATLRQIITAIESKYGTNPTTAQFDIMKNICDGLNNVLF